MVAMTQIPYITPALEQISIHTDADLLEEDPLLRASPDPYRDDGEYDWSQQEESRSI